MPVTFIVRIFSIFYALTVIGACSTRVFYHSGAVFEKMESKENYDLLYYNDSIDFSISYWGYTDYTLSPQKKEIKDQMPEVYGKNMKKYNKHIPVVLYRYKSEKMPRRLLVTTHVGAPAGLDESRNDLLRYLARRKKITAIDTITTDTAFRYDHREVKYSVDGRDSYTDVVEYHTLSGDGHLLRFVFTMDRLKKDKSDPLKRKQFLYRDAFNVMATYRKKIKSSLQEEDRKSPGLMATNVFVQSKYNYLEPLHWLQFFSASDTTERRKTSRYSALQTFSSLVGDFRRLNPSKCDTIFNPPDMSVYRTSDAVAEIMNAAEKFNVIMLNEDHLNPYSRIFARSLLSGLHQRGFRYLAVEALTYDTLLNHRPYVLKSSGFYVSEPGFGDFLRNALQSGFTLIPYENDKPCDCTDTYCRINCRERNQASNLAEIYKRDPDAKVFVYAGHGHINKSTKSKKVKYMAEQFVEITGIVPFCIDQTELTDEVGSRQCDPYYNFLKPFSDQVSSFVLKTNEGHYWVKPEKNSAIDLQVVHPPTRFVGVYPEWLVNKGDNKILFDFPKGNYAGSLLQVFYATEIQDKSDGAVPLINLMLHNNDPVTVGLPKGSFFMQIIDRFQVVHHKKEITTDN